MILPEGSLTIRMKEHKAACRLMITASERSAVPEHVWQVGHDIEILDTATMSTLQERNQSERVCVHQISSKPFRIQG